MNPGFWNRLAVVASSLAIAVIPTVFWIREKNQFVSTMAGVRSICLNGAQIAYDKGGSLIEYQSARERCFTSLSPDVGGPGWNEYIFLLILTSVGCAVAYLLIRGTVATCKWVWSGRQNDAPIDTV